MYFESIDDLKSHISERIGDIDPDVDRDAVVRLLATWVRCDADGWDLDWGDDWTPAYRDVLGDDCWVKSVELAIEDVRKATCNAR